MKRDPTVQVPWSDIDTLLLDMDGTLLDLAFDNFFWLELMPAQFARSKGMHLNEAIIELRRRYDEVSGTLPWYCVDYWSAELGLDIRSLKAAHQHMIRYLPDATAFLAAAKTRVQRVILVTNAHRATFEIKAAATGIDGLVDAVVSSHDYQAPKEDDQFWRRLTRDHQITPESCLLVEDSVAVLNAARDFGIAHLVAIRQPDSRSAPRKIDGYLAVDSVGELI
jgi:HAD superfamily hydrolase (TIGR01509 family)